jgi:hypothetical protein
MISLTSASGASQNGARRRAPVGLIAVVAGALCLLAAVTGPRPAESVGTATAERLATQPAPASRVTAAPAPVRLTISAVGVDARVEPAGVDPGTGEFAVPSNVDTVGWYRFGPGLDADAGSVVLAGHVDSAEQGRGALFRLGQLATGTRIEITGADSQVRAYNVVAREEYPKSRVPLERYFARDGAPRLALITCGGPFDDKTRHYRDNVVVTAVPA